MENTPENSIYRKVWQLIEQFYLSPQADKPASQFMPPEQMQQQLPLAIPQQGVGELECVARLAQVLAATPNTSSLGYLTTLFGGRVDAAYAGKIVSAMANNALHTFKAAGAQVLVEQEVLRFLLAAADFPSGEGAFTPGGTASNFIAMKLARERIAPEAEMQGWDGRRYRAYTSSAAHYAIKAAAGNIGLGENNLHHIAAHSNGQIDLAALSRQIEADLQAGLIPFYLNATLGTSVLGALDPIAELAAIAKRYGLWLHIDGAFGASLLLDADYKSQIQPHLADSISWDPHKMMGIPLTCSVILVKQKGAFAKAFRAPAQGDYLFQTYPDFNPGQHSNQCARSNDALPLWMALQTLGLDGYSTRVARQLALARYAAKRAAQDEAFALYCPPASINVCLRHRLLASDTACRLLDEQHGIKLSYANLQGEKYIRLVCVNPEFDEGAIEDLLAKIKALAMEETT